ncbi:hypothetical protein [Thiocystis violascens]|uniref:PFL domain-containing protein n=1 Tax=Thiocystis violascens (strain ATCC 17096 / DSM 198 / 6111) TaxID=765911 RepID=I3YDL6_THIV6|nr:hypothetical protein [Thiocystis violascens]AFL75084.1 hypothetical protein Thivi_3207 [Thiocystis violascens DSM 198]
MNEDASYSDIQALTPRERIEYYRRELRCVTPPKTYRERVLANVYHHLLQNAGEREVPSRDASSINPFTAYPFMS